MLKYTHAPGAVVSSCGSSETGSVGRTIVSVPPRFWAAAGPAAAREAPAAMTAASRTESALRNRLIGESPFGASGAGEVGQLAGEAGGLVQGVEHPVALADQG